MQTKECFKVNRMTTSSSVAPMLLLNISLIQSLLLTESKDSKWTQLVESNQPYQTCMERMIMPYKHQVLETLKFQPF